MEFWSRLQQPQLGQLLLGLLLATALLLVMVVVLIVKMSRLQKRWMSLMVGAEGRSIEHLLRDHIGERIRVEGRVEALEQRMDTAESKMRSAMRFSSVVHYDAFRDLGGQQSFSLAFFDEDGNGTVLSSLYGREDCRVYAKQLEAGKPMRTLTKEEQRAIEQAGNTRAAVRVR